jgi:lipopolysaccharide/colanic/teichoic acid biosynthesis glycosyltransferase
MTLSPYSVYPAAKRPLDIGGATLLLLVLSPFLVVVAACIWCEDGGPIFFTQLRAGQLGNPFRIWKFRTLSTGPKDPTRPSDYSTRVGTVLRRWAIDELPQLWNVLRGDMSLVGPRPVPMDQVEAYGTYERLRLQVRPGLTGWAQVHGRNAITWSERIDLDVEYVRSRTIWMDLRILIRTPLVLLRGEGIYGSNGRNQWYAQ